MTATDVSADADSVVKSEIAEVGSVTYGTPDSQTTRTLVTNGWAAAQNYASQAFTSANALLTALQAAATAMSTIPNVDVSLAAISAAVADIVEFSENFVGIADPGITLTDPDYTSAELQHLLANLDLWVQGAYTGLPTAIEQALWDRGRAREIVATSKKAQEAIRQFASRGFSKPPGALALQLLDAAQEQQDADVTNSRDVAIKQADLMQSNRRFAFEAAAKIQDSLMKYITDRQQRALDALKTVAQLKVELDAHEAQAYGAKMQYEGAYAGAQAQVQRARVDVAIAEGNLRIESAKANIQSLIERARVFVEAIRGAAQIQGQLAASALSAVNLSGGLHDSTSWGLSVNQSRTTSVSANIGSSSNRQENYTP